MPPALHDCSLLSLARGAWWVTLQGTVWFCWDRITDPPRAADYPAVSSQPGQMAQGGYQVYSINLKLSIKGQVC